MIIFAPLAAVIAIAIKTTSSGPVFYRQKRVGQHKALFVINKFRTMWVDSDRKGVATLPGDSRITIIGKLIRPLHLDELPQLWNVLIGEMTLIGPRPRSADHCVEIRRYIPDFDNRHCVKPGLTGLAQVGKNHDHTQSGLEESFALDMEYLQTRSFISDLKIIAMTALAVIQRKGV
jgi:lipopolysaccharide/colanic/teichoic acid biosynthesis glycosyltransferase